MSLILLELEMIARSKILIVLEDSLGEILMVRGANQVSCLRMPLSLRHIVYRLLATWCSQLSLSLHHIVYVS